MAAQDLRSLTVRLASTAAELRAAQVLRYQVFYSEFGVAPSEQVAALGYDADELDRYCDHVIVVDESRSDGELPMVVGNYRVLRASVGREGCGFFSGTGYDLSFLDEYQAEALELGRSCVHPDYRTRGVMFLLWQGLADYVLQHDVDLLFGRASFIGSHTAGREHALSYLHHFRPAPKTFRLAAIPECRIEMNLTPKAEVDVRQAMAQMPPLLKGYLRLGCTVGDGAVIDHDLDQLDVFVLVQVSEIADRYFRHYLDRNRVGVEAA